jgi:hypothetical protein
MRDDSLKLQYANPPIVWHQRRPWRRAIFVLVVAMGIGLTAWSCHSIPGDWARYRYWRYCVENHTPMKQLPSFSTDPIKSAAMLHSDNFISSLDDNTTALYYPTEWAERTVGFGDDGITFLHHVRQPSGSVRLVAVGINRSGYTSSFTGPTSIGGAVLGGQKIHYVHLNPMVFVLKDGRYTVSTIAYAGGLLIPWNEPFSLFDGVPDPADASRFTIGYSLRGQAGTIEGRIDNNDAVTFRVLAGPLVLFGPNAPSLIPPVQYGP